MDDPERGTVISFNGTANGAYVRAGYIPQMTLTNDFTWAFWAKQDAGNTTPNDIIFGNRKDDNAADFVPRQFIKFTPTKFEWHMNGNGNDNLEYDDIPADVWLNHAVVKAGDQLTYYRNGIEASSGTFTQPLDFPQPLFFGGDNEGAAGEMWRGYLSDARIYDRALSADEISELAGVISDTVENLLQNPSFEEDEAILDDPDWVKWCTWNPAEGAGSNATIVDTESIDGARSLRIEPKGDTNWYFIVLYLSFPADADKNYTTTFWAKAEASRPLTVQMKAADNSINAWGATDFELTTEWTEYTYTSEVLIADVKLEILCAGSEVPFWLDLVSIYEAD